MKTKILSETPADYDAIGQINDLAFGQENEGTLVERLRKDPYYIKELSLVAFLEDEPVGHILFFPVVIKNDPGEHEILSLAPMSVLPEFQNMGIGSQLVREGLRICKEKGYRSVAVLGHEKFYPRFGFIPASQFGIKPPFEVPDVNFMAMELVPDALSGVHGTLIYPSEFDNV